MSKNQEVFQYVQKQMSLANSRANTLTKDRAGNKYPKRYLFYKMREYATDFLDNRSENRWIVIPGLRGVGKTTVLAQLYLELKSRSSDPDLLFISLDEINNLLKVGLSEVLEAYEQILGTNYEKLERPVLLFIDEAQTDPGWAGILKNLYDKTKNVFIISSGSSAIGLQMNADAARRAIMEKLYPLSFSEYGMIKNQVEPQENLSREIKQALFFSSSAGEAHQKLKAIETQVNQYWSKMDRLEVKHYLTIGTLPFALGLKEQAQVFDAISLLLDRVISKDIAALGKFDTKTLAVVKRLLLVLAESDAISLYKLEQVLEINRLTIAEILDVLGKAELLIKVPAHGANISAVRKPAKYLFMSPAIRMAFFSIAGIESTWLTRQGKLLEDTVAFYYYREILSKGIGSLSYDSSEGSADFIFRVANKTQIAAEIGIGKKNSKQIAKTLKNIKCDYGITISQEELKLDKTDDNILMVPLDYFLLI
jgi:uncharacterized protein